ncbi:MULTISPECIES: UDP-4-amino-4,6-dideoxy-N-acetyl-beta-L-altrosamine N-acetyltransferase [unclassified Psychrobacter]|uniref:UDP-4-amino-4, 6-dideoxy-N-acetyl-beta-L-altrosamine N-acetyltransferase n=1 Tax=unclassified Psychrobacter TaxID=196806 RepID=UPI001B329E8D|nr:UDP-4-amino-4,6-dideoxy-N-acetyl-beta-L-altrosamine N-acetyltransferase [Psychrobacter sp. K31L]MBP3946185.1 UDP-4-amino-4,6-dideoxy-N-acetyl-beta-L-altrosamine N-acetyltransferase [Psychrobacter sp. K31L]
MFKGNFRKLVDEDINRLYEWRNRDEIRLNMYNHDIIDYETHVSWFNKVGQDSTNQYFIYEQDGNPLGLVSFTNIDSSNKTASWAFYSANVSIRGIGSEMERLALDYAFKHLELNKLYCEVLDFNFPVVKFHRKHGFKIEGIKKQHYCRDGKYYDVYQLSLFKKDYDKISKDDFKPSINKYYKWNFSVESSKIDIFADFSGDNNPIHIQDESAIELGFEGRIAHGAILVAEISRVAASDYPGPNTIYVGQDLKYYSPVYPDMEIIGQASLLTQIGRYCLIEYKMFDKDNKLLMTSLSEFLIGK